MTEPVIDLSWIDQFHLSSWIIPLYLVLGALTVRLARKMGIDEGAEKGDPTLPLVFLLWPAFLAFTGVVLLIVGLHWLSGAKIEKLKK